MARDYKSRATPRKPAARKPVPGWVWFISGLLVGLFFSGLAWLKLLPAKEPSVTVITQQRPAQQQPKPKAEQGKAATKERGDVEKPRFDFYTILPEMEVVVPDPEPQVSRQPPKQPVNEGRDSGTQANLQQPPATMGADTYMLQMGSFRRYSDADRLKASLALIGMHAEIQKVTVKDGDVFHRVRSGPYTREKAERLRAVLKRNKISNLLIKLKS